jgi:hypothetical protein
MIFGINQTKNNGKLNTTCFSKSFFWGTKANERRIIGGRNTAVKWI